MTDTPLTDLVMAVQALPRTVVVNNEPDPAWMPRWPKGLYEDAQGFFHHCGPELDLATFERYSASLNRNNAPALLFDLVYRDKTLDVARVPGAVGSAWTAAEYPEQALGEALWSAIFGRAGYAHDGQPADRPSDPVQLFRGCTSGRRFGMSWTTELEVARRFAFGGIRGRSPGHVYVATVQPEHLLAYPGPKYRGESEFIVRPDGLSDENVSQFE